MRLRAGWPALLLASAGCAGGSAPAAGVAPDETASLTPVADHHQHLLSPAMAANWSSRPLAGAGVEIPDDVARLLAERASAFGDSSALAHLFTDDGLLTVGQRSSWIRGQGPVGAQLARTFARPYRVTVLSYRAEGATATLAGYLSRGEGDSVRHFGQVLLGLRRAGGEWRIAAEALTFPGVAVFEPLTADQLIAMLDAAGIRRAAVLSAAYIYGDPRNPTQYEYAKVRAENDWTSREVARFPDRLRGLCGVSPLKEYALAELDRCANQLGLRGLKLHFANSVVDVRNPLHVEQLRRVFRAANDRRLPIVAHLWTTDPTYGREHSEIFLERILPVAPDIPIQIAHLAGAGPRYPEQTDRALSVFAEAIAAGDPRTRNLYFDVASNVTIETPEAEAASLVRRLRQIGMARILYGSDRAEVGVNPPPRQGWAVFRAMLPLTDAEIRAIASNVAPYLR